MRMIVKLYTEPQSIEAEDDIENSLEDPGLALTVQNAIEIVIQRYMGWRDLWVHAKIVKK